MIGSWIILYIFGEYHPLLFIHHYKTEVKINQQLKHDEIVYLQQIRQPFSALLIWPTISAMGKKWKSIKF